jgi:hypothetical protein
MFVERLASDKIRMKNPEVGNADHLPTTTNKGTMIRRPRTNFWLPDRFPLLAGFII